jgi:hypothetical protein
VTGEIAAGIGAAQLAATPQAALDRATATGSVAPARTKKGN